MNHIPSEHHKPEQRIRIKNKDPHKGKMPTAFWLPYSRPTSNSQETELQDPGIPKVENRPASEDKIGSKPKGKFAAK